MPWFVTLALFVISYALQALLVPSNRQKPASLEDFDFPQFEENTPQAIVFGDVNTQGWFVSTWLDLRTKKIKQGKK